MKKILSIFISLMTIVCLADIIKSNSASKFIQLNNIDEQITAKSYVQDGLVCMWDGIENIGWGEHDDESTYWVELISGTSDYFRGKIGINFTWSNNANIRLSYGYLGSFNSDKTDVLLNSFRECSFTVEIVTSSPIDSAGWQAQILNICNSESEAYNRGIICRYRGENNGYSGNVYTGTYTSGGDIYIQPYNALQTWTCSYDAGYGNFFSNGLFHSNATVTPQSNLEHVIVRIGGYNYAFRGHYHCMRIYNRALTSSEVSHNAKIDKIRFQ